MKGIVFTEFLEMVEDRYSPDIADSIIEACRLASGGAYTAVGTYTHDELVQLVTQLSRTTATSIPDLLRAFGKHLFGRFALAYPQFFDHVPSTFAFLERIEDHIHVEVRKLYPDAELPSFTCDTPHPGQLRLLYQSTRPFADFAEGLILGCIEHFGEALDVQRDDLSTGNGTCVRFVLTRQG